MATILVYVNGTRVMVEGGAPVLEAIRAWDAGAAVDVAEGRRSLTDSRGLPLDPATPTVSGAIMRVVTARDRDPGDEPG